MPLIAGQVPWLPSWATPNHFPDAVVEGPKRDVVLGVVVAGGEPVAMGLDVDQDARATVEIAGEGLELQADGAVCEVVHAIKRCDRIIGKLLDVIDEILLRGVVEAARPLSQQGGAVVLV